MLAIQTCTPRLRYASSRFTVIKKCAEHPRFFVKRYTEFGRVSTRTEFKSALQITSNHV